MIIGVYTTAEREPVTPFDIFSIGGVLVFMHVFVSMRVSTSWILVLCSKML